MEAQIASETFPFFKYNPQLYLLKYFLHKVQLHVSALDNGHLQVVHEILIKQLYIYIMYNLKMTIIKRRNM